MRTDETATPRRDGQRSQSAVRPGGAAVGPSIEARHRRRRAAALAALAVIALIAGISAGAGGGGAGSPHPRGSPTAFFARIQALAGTGSGSFAAQQQAAENAAIDRTLAYTPYVRLGGAQSKEIALTFDDGPGPFTPQVVSVLARENVPATFFAVGVLEKYFHAGTSEIVARGYPIGDHTQSHAPMSKLSKADQRSQIIQETSAVGAFGAPFPRLFRPPYGLWSRTTLGLLRTYKMLMVLWTVDTEDYRRPGVAAIVSSAVQGARPGAIILMHDAGGNRQETVDALPQIISKLRSRGYRFVTIPRLLLDNPAPANQSLPAGTAGGGG